MSLGSPSKRAKEGMPMLEPCLPDFSIAIGSVSSDVVQAASTCCCVVKSLSHKACHHVSLLAQCYQPAPCSNSNNICSARLMCSFVYTGGASSQEWEHRSIRRELCRLQRQRTGRRRRARRGEGHREAATERGDGDRVRHEPVIFAGHLLKSFITGTAGAAAAGQDRRRRQPEPMTNKKEISVRCSIIC